MGNYLTSNQNSDNNQNQIEASFGMQGVEVALFNFPNGIIYEGEWRDGFRHGKGRQIWPDGSHY